MELSHEQLFSPPGEYASLEKAHFVAAAVPIEASVSYGSGASKGPEALLHASQQVELFDVEEQNEPYRAGIATCAFPQPFSQTKEALAYAQEITLEILNAQKIPIILGGDHSLTPGVLAAFVQKDTSFSVFHIDAHSDLRDSYHGDPHSHASALRRVLAFPAVRTLVQVGIRNVSNDPEDGSEFSFIQDNTDRVKIFFAKDMALWNISEMVDALAHDVYITIDVDGFDPSIMPSTGTPEPGGIDWYTALRVLREVCTKKNVIGLDIVELAPIPGFHAPDFLVAKLIYKLIGYISKAKGYL
ncbi:MAG: agmatinase [Patescibacteria group bacterium]